ncbi:MAG: hypothetical protein AB8B53_13905 [Flavobacteriales bacterium]
MRSAALVFLLIPLVSFSQSGSDKKFKCIKTFSFNTLSYPESETRLVALNYEYSALPNLYTKHVALSEDSVVNEYMLLSTVHEVNYIEAFEIELEKDLEKKMPYKFRCEHYVTDSANLVTYKLDLYLDHEFNIMENVPPNCSLSRCVDLQDSLEYVSLTRVWNHKTDSMSIQPVTQELVDYLLGWVRFDYNSEAQLDLLNTPQNLKAYFSSPSIFNEANKTYFSVATRPENTYKRVPRKFRKGYKKLNVNIKLKRAKYKGTYSGQFHEFWFFD